VESNFQSDAKRALLLAVAALVLWLPYDHIFTSTSQLRGIFNFVFPNAFHHFLGHTLIFSLFGSVLLYLVVPLRRKQLLYFALCIFAAVVQEGIQAIFLKQGLQFDATAFCGDSLGTTIALICRTLLVRNQHDQ
jgi:hypothetical protein